MRSDLSVRSRSRVSDYSHFRELLIHEAGTTSLATGMVRLNVPSTTFSESHRFDHDVVNAAQFALRHEMIHNIQSISTAYVFARCEQVRAAVTTFRQWLADSRRPATFISELRAHLATVQRSMHAPTGADPIDGVGFSAQDLMEAAAVLEAFRSTEMAGDDEVFLRLIERLDRPEYTRVLGACGRALGPGPTVRLASTMAFVALNTAEPGTTFTTMLTELHELAPSRVASMGPEDVFDGYMSDRAASLLTAFALDQQPSNSMIWNRVGETWAKSGPIDVVHLVSSNPSFVLAETIWSKELDENAVAYATPMMTLFVDGVVKIGGYLTSMPESELADHLVALAHTDELIGAMLRLGDPERDLRNVCVHTPCHEHASRMCHFAYPPAAGGDWTSCAFRSRFSQLSGMQIGECYERYA